MVFRLQPLAWHGSPHQSPARSGMETVVERRERRPGDTPVDPP